MHRTLLALLGISMMTSGCATATGAQRSEAQAISPTNLEWHQLPLVAHVGFQAVIIPFTNGTDLTWVPTQDDVVAAEADLQRCLRARFSDIHAPLASYVRQYSGTHDDRRQLLRVRFFDLAALPELNWRHGFLGCFDCGAKYYGLLYDAEAHACQPE
jgi:hypothetical protein